MVEITEIVDLAVVPPSEERLRDAQEIESAASKLLRPTAKMQLESLAKKLRKESDALKRLEASAQVKQQQERSDEEDKPLVEEVTKAPAPAQKVVKPIVKPATAAATAAPVSSSTAKYVPISTFAFDSGKYNSPTVTIYISFNGVKDIPRDNITCNFTSTSIDLIIRNLNNKSHRLIQDNLAHDIDPTTSKIIIKTDRIIIKLGKCQNEYSSYDTWTDLIAKKPRKDNKSGKKKEDPSAGIMDMMKDLYDTGDDNMRKIIGETMEKQRRGDLGGAGGKSGGDDMDDM